MELSQGSGDREIFEGIADLLARKQGYPRERITLTTRLLDDTGMDGADSNEFLEAFAGRFGVDMSGYQWYRHFGPEGCNPFWLIRPPWWGRLRHFSITVADLVEAARAKRWLMEYPTDDLPRRRGA